MGFLKDSTLGVSEVLVVRVSAKSFLNEGLEHGRFGCDVIAKFSEPFLLMYA